MTGKYKAVFFDLDGVLLEKHHRYREKNIGVSTWHVLFDRIGALDEHDKLRDRFLQGEFPSYMEWSDQALKTLQANGLNKTIFDNIVSTKPYMPGAVETLQELKNRGLRVAVISGGILNIAYGLRKYVDEMVVHTELLFGEDGALSEWNLIPCDFKEKVDYFHKIAKSFGVKPEECVYVGDDTNDLHLFPEVGLSIAFNSDKEEVRERADVVIDRKDLREVLKHV